MNVSTQAILNHQSRLRRCALCPDMFGPPVVGRPVVSPVLLVGQAPGPHEQRTGSPFAWTAGRTLFRWFTGLGLSEEQFRDRVYMAAVCRCFPGKRARGGDRVPSAGEIARCAPWLDRELAMLRPDLILPVGKLAVSRFIPVPTLRDVVGSVYPVALAAKTADVIPLPHPSGASVWFKTEPGKTLLARALRKIGSHPAWAVIAA
jgi:uracil-DNA glycosylase